MAECRASRAAGADYLTLTVIGKVTAGEVIAWINEFYGDAGALNVLWDYTDGDLSGLLADDIQYVLAAARQYEAIRRDGRTAFVVNTRANFNVGSLYDFIVDVEGYAVKVGIFKTRAEAVDWLST